MYDEESLYKELIENPLLNFIKRNIINGISIYYITNNIRMHFSDYGKSIQDNISGKESKKYNWLFGNTLPRHTRFGQYAIRYTQDVDPIKVMNKLYKRHRQRFIKYYEQKHRTTE